MTRLISKVQSITPLHSIYNDLFSLVLALQPPSVTCLHARHQSYDDYLDASAPPLPHSFSLLTGWATHGSNLPLQHHLVTTAVIQEAFSQINEGEEIPLVFFFFFAPFLVIPVWSSGWCLSPSSSMMVWGKLTASRQTTNVRFFILLCFITGTAPLITITFSFTAMHSSSKYLCWPLYGPGYYITTPRIAQIEPAGLYKNYNCRHKCVKLEATKQNGVSFLIASYMKGSKIFWISQYDGSFLKYKKFSPMNP